MNSRDRFDGFLRRSPIDRVPVQLQNLILAAQATGRDFPVVCRNAELIASGHAIEWEKYRHDGVIVDIGTHAAAEALGCTVEYAPGELPRVSTVAIQESDERRRLVIPDICNTPPRGAVLRDQEGRIAVVCLQAQEQVVEAIGMDLPSHLGVPRVLQVACPEPEEPAGLACVYALGEIVAHAQEIDGVGGQGLPVAFGHAWGDVMRCPRSLPAALHRPRRA